MAGNQDKPSIIGWAVTAWRDTATAIQQMPVALGVGALVVLALQVLSEVFVLPKPREESSIEREFLISIFGVIQAFFLTPVAIAVHRFVLLGEPAGKYRLEPADPRFRQFFLFVVVLQIFFLIPGMTISLAGGASHWLQPVVVVVSLLLYVYAIVVMTRTLILFPAIAVDAAGAAWSNALQDTAGYAWRIFFMSVAAGIPILPAYIVLASLWPDDATTVRTACLAIADAVVATLTTIVYAALASRMFAVLGVRLVGSHGDDAAQR